MPSRTMQFRTGSLMALSLVALFLACGGDGLPSGPEGVFVTPDTTDIGVMRAVMTDDPGAAGGTAYSGTVTGRGDVEVSTNNKTWYTMGTPRDFSLALQAAGVTVDLTVSADILPGTYRFVRINWSQTTVNLNSGSQVGSLTLDSDVVLRLGDAAVAVMHQEVGAFELVPGAQARIVVDLNSEKWMKERFVTAREITKQDFEAGAKVSIVAGN